MWQIKLTHVSFQAHVKIASHIIFNMRVYEIQNVNIYEKL